MGSFEETAQTLTTERPEAYCGTCDRSYPIDQLTCSVDGTKLVRFRAQADTMLGRVLDGRYRIETKLGQGGMGAVYRGRQLSIEREVAIKVVSAAIAADRDAAKRFLREARLASSLNAPGIVAVYDFGQSDDGVLYLVMELVDGNSLAELLRSKQPLDPARVVAMGLQLCDALATAHSAGIVHRDLKPANIVALDTPTGEVVKVLDFGIAKATDTPSITSTQGMIGTPVYMAPEQFEGRSDVRSDMYSLGCVLHELVTGAPPFWANDINALLTKHLVESPPPVPANVPPKLARAIERLLAKEPGARFQSAIELRNALKGAAPYQSGPIIRTSMMALPDPLAMTEETAAATPAATITAPAVDAPATVAGTHRRTMALVGGFVAAALLGTAVFFMLQAPASRPAASSTDGPSGAPAPAMADPAPEQPASLTRAAEQPVDAGVDVHSDAAVTPSTVKTAATVTPAKVRPPPPRTPPRPKITPRKPNQGSGEAITPKKLTPVTPGKGSGEVELPFVKTK